MKNEMDRFTIITRQFCGATWILFYIIWLMSIIVFLYYQRYLNISIVVKAIIFLFISSIMVKHVFLVYNKLHVKNEIMAFRNSIGLSCFRRIENLYDVRQTNRSCYFKMSFSNEHPVYFILLRAEEKKRVQEWINELNKKRERQDKNKIVYYLWV